MMPGVLEAVPVITSGLFAGGLVSIAVGESLANESSPPDHARKHFQRAFKRTGAVQVPLLLLGAATSGWLAARGGPTQRENLATCALMTGIFAGTGLVIVPINNKLCSEEELSDSEVKSSLRQWNTLNRVRTVASVVAFCLATAGLAASPKTLDRVHIAY